MRPLARRAGGVSVLEAVVALLLGVLLMALILSVLVRQREVVAALGRRAEALSTLRTVRVLLRREGRAMGVGAWQASSDSVALRAFRGTGTACPDPDGATVVRVSPWGVRAPDPAKDSVLVFTSRGEVLLRALVITEAGGGACGPGDAGGRERWTLSEPVPTGAVLVRYFEHGSYHLSGGAFRYRRGEAGRQPLTPEALLTPASRFLPSGTGLHALLFFDGPPPRRSLDLFIGRRGP